MTISSNLLPHLSGITPHNDPKATPNPYKTLLSNNQSLQRPSVGTPGGLLLQNLPGGRTPLQDHLKINELDKNWENSS
jgi:hypothetical protein